MERAPRLLTYTELIAAVSGEFGIALEIVNTGGGSEVLHGRLETGHWLVVTDAEDFLADIGEQLRGDVEGYPLGWFAGVYENDATDGCDRPASYAEGGCVTYVQRDEARFDEVNAVIREVLQQFSDMR